MNGPLRHFKAGTVILVLALLLLSIFAIQPAGLSYSPSETTAWKVTGPIVIDGDLGEWDKSSPIVLENRAQVYSYTEFWGGPSDLSARVYLMWDENNLYVGAEVKDVSPFVSGGAGRIDQLDSMGLYFSTNPNADPNRGAYESTDFRVVLAIDNYYFDTGIDRDMVENKAGIGTKGMYGGEQVLNGYERAVGAYEGGYTFEAKIPLSNFSNENIPLFVPVHGVSIGFDVELNDIDTGCPGEYVRSMAWVGTSGITSNPSGWGTLKFKALERPPWFVDDDNEVGLSDLMIVAYHYGETPSSPGWLPAADVDRDGEVGLTDLMIVAYHYGETWVAPK